MDLDTEILGDVWAKSELLPQLTCATPEEGLRTSKIQGRDICPFSEPVDIVILDNGTDGTKLNRNSVLEE